MWGLKTRTVARESWIGDLNLRKGAWFWNFDKIFSAYQIVNKIA